MKMNGMNVSLGLWVVVGVACGSSNPSPKTTPTEQGNAGNANLAETRKECEQDVAQLTAALDEVKAIASADPGALQAGFERLSAALAGWERADAPCQKLLQANDSEGKKLAALVEERAETEGVELRSSLIDRLLQAEAIAEARVALSTWYGQESRENVVHELIALAEDVSRKYDQYLYKKFQKSKAYAWLDDKATCVFSEKTLKPSKKLRENFQTFFVGTKKIHVLCRLNAEPKTFESDAELTIQMRSSASSNGSHEQTMVVDKSTLSAKQPYVTTHLELQEALNEPSYVSVKVVLRKASGQEEVHGTDGFFWAPEPKKVEAENPEAGETQEDEPGGK